jgi:hypothetical protein
LALDGETHRVDADDFNVILWKGLVGNKPYPATPSGIDLRQNRWELLAPHQQAMKKKEAKQWSR